MSIAVGNVNLGEQCAGGGINGIGGARHCAGKFLSGILIQQDVRAHAFTNGRRGALRHADVDAQRIDLGQIKQFFVLAIAAGSDQRSGIHIAAGEHAGKGSVDVLEGFQLLKTAHVGVRSGKVGLCLAVGTGLLVGFLLRY